jgi:OmcA/MtrC family decaheme c-type cytochrome
MLVGATLLMAACEGPTGPAGEGTTALTSTSSEPAGTNCANGGVKVEVGLDANDNGTLDPTEVTGRSYVCNGNGTNSLVRTGAEPAGANCPFGGTRIESGLDTNNNGVLDDSEVIGTGTSYVCNFGPSGTISPSEGINVTYKLVSTSTTAPITVRFVMRDDRGYPLDIYGVYSLNTPIQPRFALSYFTKDANGTVSPLTTYTKSTSVAVPAGQPTNYNPLAATGNGTLVENGLGAGDYTYTFPTTSITNGVQAVAYDPTKLDATHVVWMQVTRQTDLAFQQNANTFYAANPSYNYIPSGNGTPGVREIASQAKCDNCHAKFQAETLTSAAFHGGGRVNVGMCNVCHNAAHVSNPLANSASFVHRIHNGENVAGADRFHGIAVTYPQDLKTCDTCHGGAAQGQQSLTNLSQLACKGCHAYVAFDNSAPGACGLNGAVVKDANGIPVPCNHVGGPQPDNACVTCHGPAGTFATSRYHVPVVPPDPMNLWKTPVGGNANTNASYVAEASFTPAGANKITYQVKSVETWTDTTVTPNLKRPSITFKFQLDGTDVTFNTLGVKTELIDNFVGSPSAYFAFAVPQDGNATPTDFNASVSAYVKSVWNGTASGASAGALAGPDSSGYYTLKLTGVQIPPSATMLTGGVGYTYALTGTPPLVQTNLSAFPWVPNVPADGKAQGGLSVPAPDVWKVATGYTARRNIVETAKCNTCHAQLGVGPTFHAGQRNDGPTCSFCHNPNKTSAGWAAGSKYFIHAIHSGRKRVVPYTWHAASVGAGYDEVEFPGTLNTCTTCHTANTFDFTNPTNLAAFASEPLSTVATGKYSTDPLVNSTYYTISPYVIGDNVTDYGAGFAYNAATNVTTQAAPSTLVLSPLTGACSACHDSNAALDHMKQNGGYFYAPRSVVLAPSAPQEQCMICHGPGRVAAIGMVHQH